MLFLGSFISGQGGVGTYCRSFAVFVTDYVFWFDFRFVSVTDVFVPMDDGSKSKVQLYSNFFENLLSQFIRASFVSICKSVGTKQLIYM